MSSNKYFNFFLLILFANIVLADDVELKSNKTYYNVKTNLQKDKLQIIQEDGKSFQIPLASIKKIKPQEVKWISKKDMDSKGKQETKQIKINETNTTLSQDSETKNKIQKEKTLESLIPFWSGLNRTKYWYLGFSLSAIELATFYNFTQFKKNPEHPIPDFVFYYYLNEIRIDKGIKLEERQEIKTYLFLNYYNNYHSLSPDGQTLSDAHYFLERRHAFRSFLFSVLFNAGITYLLTGKGSLSEQLSQPPQKKFFMALSPNFNTKNQGFDFSFNFYF